jgi:hypothetical protein
MDLFNSHGDEVVTAKQVTNGHLLAMSPHRLPDVPVQIHMTDP